MAPGIFISRLMSFYIEAQYCWATTSGLFVFLTRLRSRGTASNGHQKNEQSKCTALYQTINEKIVSKPWRIMIRILEAPTTYYCEFMEHSHSDRNLTHSGVGGPRKQRPNVDTVFAPVEVPPEFSKVDPKTFGVCENEKSDFARIGDLLNFRVAGYNTVVRGPVLDKASHFLERWHHSPGRSDSLPSNTALNR